MTPKFDNRKTKERTNWIANDITFCGNGDKCPLKTSCRRAQDPGVGVHSFSLFYNENKECEYHLLIKEE